MGASIGSSGPDHIPFATNSSNFQGPAPTPAETNVEVGPFSNAPTVALEIVAEEELRDLGVHAAFRFLRVLEEILDLLRDHGFFFSEFRIQKSRNRTEMAAGADEERGGKPPVNEPTIGTALESLHRNATFQLRTGSSNQIAVEFAAPDGVTDRR